MTRELTEEYIRQAFLTYENTGFCQQDGTFWVCGNCFCSDPVRKVCTSFRAYDESIKYLSQLGAEALLEL
jgi:hypothetical protein